VGSRQESSAVNVRERSQWCQCRVDEQWVRHLSVTMPNTWDNQRGKSKGYLESQLEGLQAIVSWTVALTPVARQHIMGGANCPSCGQGVKERKRKGLRSSYPF
jgi:hypothetical protein